MILNDGYIQSEQVTEDILKKCADDLPDYMIPDEIVYRKEFPRTSRGKVDYRALEKEAAEMH